MGGQSELRDGELESTQRRWSGGGSERRWSRDSRLDERKWNGPGTVGLLLGRTLELCACGHPFGSFWRRGARAVCRIHGAMEAACNEWTTTLYRVSRLASFCRLCETGVRGTCGVRCKACVSRSSFSVCHLSPTLATASTTMRQLSMQGRDDG